MGGTYRKLPKIEGYTRSEVVSFLREKLRSDKKYAIRALEVLYNRQTEYEKLRMKTTTENNIGFTSSHAPRLMHIWKLYSSKKELLPEQWRYLMLVIWHYAEQLVEVSDITVLTQALNKYYNKCLPAKDIEVKSEE